MEPSAVASDSGTSTAGSKRLRLSDRSRISTHETLLAVGMELFLTQGIAKTTATKIAERANVSVGTFYLHFRDKEALLAEAWKSYFQDNLSHLLSIVSPQEGNRPDQIVERVRANAAALVRWVEARPAEYLFWSGHEVALTDAGRENQRTWSNWLEERIRIDQSYLLGDTDPAIGAQAILGICNRVLRWWLADKSRADREAVIAALARFHLSLYNVPGVSHL